MTIYGHIWFESGMLACVLACFSIYGDLSAKDCQKYAKYTDFAPSWILNVQSGPLVLYDYI